MEQTSPETFLKLKLDANTLYGFGGVHEPPKHPVLEKLLFDTMTMRKQMKQEMQDEPGVDINVTNVEESRPREVPSKPEKSLKDLREEQHRVLRHSTSISEMAKVWSDLNILSESRKEVLESLAKLMFDLTARYRMLDMKIAEHFQV